MKIVKASYEIETPIDRSDILIRIERAGRTCYKSEDKITEDSASRFVKQIMERNHLSVIEHVSITVRFINDRGVSHEQVRNRLCSFSQESTRFCNYSTGKFGGEISVIDIEQYLKKPEFSLGIWFDHMIASEKAYNDMIDAGESPQIARSVLPNSLKTEIVITANLREWKLIFSQRAAKTAHPQMQEVMVPLQKEFQKILPEIFGEVE